MLSIELNIATFFDYNWKEIEPQKQSRTMDDSGTS